MCFVQLRPWMCTRLGSHCGKWRHLASHLVSGLLPLACSLSLLGGRACVCTFVCVMTPNIFLAFLSSGWIPVTRTDGMDLQQFFSRMCRYTSLPGAVHPLVGMLGEVDVPEGYLEVMCQCLRCVFSRFFWGSSLYSILTALLHAHAMSRNVPGPDLTKDLG